MCTFKVSKEDHPLMRNNMRRLNDFALEHAEQHYCNRIQLVGEDDLYWYYRCWEQDTNGIEII